MSPRAGPTSVRRQHASRPRASRRAGGRGRSTAGRAAGQSSPADVSTSCASLSDDGPSLQDALLTPVDCLLDPYRPAALRARFHPSATERVAAASRSSDDRLAAGSHRRTTHDADPALVDRPHARARATVVWAVGRVDNEDATADARAATAAGVRRRARARAGFAHPVRLAP